MWERRQCDSLELFITYLDKKWTSVPFLLRLRLSGGDPSSHVTVFWAVSFAAPLA